MKTYKLSKKGICIECRKFALLYWLLNSIPLLSVISSLNILYTLDLNLYNFINKFAYIIIFIYSILLFVLFVPSRNNKLKELKSINLIINNDLIIKKQKNFSDIKINKSTIKSINITKNEVKIITKNIMLHKIIFPFKFQNYNDLKNTLIDFSK